MPNVIHECPADGSEHTTSESCSCGPVRVGHDEDGNELWKHRSAIEQQAISLGMEPEMAHALAGMYFAAERAALIGHALADAIR